MESIKIVKSPSSVDPEIRRLQLLGLVLQLPSVQTLKQVHNLVPDKGKFVVLTKTVIRELKDAGKDSAVEYWSSKGELFMEFRVDECKVISQ